MINIGGIESFSIVDYPGKIAAVLFLSGCPWRCPFCYNTHLQTSTGKSDYDWEEVKKHLKKRQGLLDAVVFSGGEPLMQKGVVDAIKEVKAMGYEVALHTCGCYPETLKQVLPYITWLGLDIKAPFEEEHYLRATSLRGSFSSSLRGSFSSSLRGKAEAIQSKTNNPLSSVLQSLDIILASGISFETRTTCDPKILSIDDIYKIAIFLKQKGVKNYHLQRYRQIEGDPTPDAACERFFTNKELEKFLKDNFENVELRK